MFIESRHTLEGVKQNPLRAIKCFDRAFSKVCPPAEPPKVTHQLVVDETPVSPMTKMKKDLSLKPFNQRIQTSQSSSQQKFRIRNVKKSDTPMLCSWVTTRKALITVSGDDGNCLTPKILQKWIAKSLSNFVVSEIATDKPVGFCTFSIKELDFIPIDYVELCHLIVDPEKRYFFIGERLCRAVKIESLKNGFNYLVGRIVPWNKYAKALAKREKFTEIITLPRWASNGFHWYLYNLKLFKNES